MPAIVEELRGGGAWRRAAFVLAGADDHDLTKLSEYESIGGYQALAKARAMTPDAVIEELKASQLRGRGGAFFATGLKWSFVPKPDAIPKPHYLVVNADESEPGSFKDNEILLACPAPLHRGLPDHGARGRVEVGLRLRPRRVHRPVRDPRRGARGAAGRADIRGDVSILVHRGAGAYICGEETALLESLEGKRGQPRTKPPFPAVRASTRRRPSSTTSRR